MPPPALPSPPTLPACSRQEQTGSSERQRSTRTRGSHAGLALATGMQVCYQQQKAQAHNVHTFARTHIHTHAQVHTHTHTNTGAHTHRHTYTGAHTHTHALATAPKQHAKLAHACSSSSSSDIKVATHKPPGLQKPL